MDRDPNRTAPAPNRPDPHRKAKRKAMRAAWRSPTKSALVRVGTTLVLGGRAHLVDTPRGKEITAETVVFTVDSSVMARNLLATWREMHAADPDRNVAEVLADAVRAVDAKSAE